MHVMDDTLADQSGIPFLSSTDDVPVHSTPIKGTKIPLPSTKNVMKYYMSRPERYEEFTDAESLQSIRHSDLHPRVRDQPSAHKGKLNSVETRHFQLKGDRNVQDVSNVDNLRRKSRDHPVDRAFHHERSGSPKQGQRSTISGHEEYFKKNKDVQSSKMTSIEDEKCKIVGKYDIDDSQLTEQLKRFDERQNQDVDKQVIENENSNAFSSNANRSKHLSNGKNKPTIEVSDNILDVNGQKAHNMFNVNDVKSNEYSDRGHGTKQACMKVETRTRVRGRLRDGYGERRSSMNSPRRVSTHSASSNSTLSASKQNTSLSELENTTLQKQRQEIQLLMNELRDRDRELSDMMSSHQQQLVAWKQDRDRLVSVERKCMQYEDDLRTKASQLRNTVNNLKSMKCTESENRVDLEKYRAAMDKLTKESNEYQDEVGQLQVRNDSLQGNVNDLSNAVGRMEARKEELTTSLRLKEKDISSATSHMKELSERLLLLDLRCKECQDKEREALKEKHEWKQKYENSREEFHTLTSELDHKRKEVVRLAEEDRSARQQLSLIQKEADMMERCKDELIDSMRVKQERTDTQLRNMRELYDRQLREVATLQMQLDNSKELIYRQQNSIDEQQLSCSYQGRGSHSSEYSLERSSASQRHSGRNRSSPTHSSKYREPDTTASHQQTQSSGYQSQLYENQTGNQPAPNSFDNNYINLTGSKQSIRQYNNERNDQARFENQSVCKHSDSQHLARDNDFKVKFSDPHPGKNGDISNSNYEMHNVGDMARELDDQVYPTVPSEVESSATQYHTPPREQRQPSFDSPQRKDGFVIEHNVIQVQPEEINPDAVKPSNYCALSQTALQAIERAENMLLAQADVQKVTNKSVDVIQDFVGKDKGAIADTEQVLSDNYQNENLDGQTVGKEQEAFCDIEFQKKYTFENKLCSFLEDLDDIDDSIWDEKPTRSVNVSIVSEKPMWSANVSTAESSPANKLRKLLIESQQMIQSLEKSAESPRLSKGREPVGQNERETSVSSEDKLQQSSI